MTVNKCERVALEHKEWYVIEGHIRTTTLFGLASEMGAYVMQARDFQPPFWLSRESFTFSNAMACLF